MASAAVKLKFNWGLTQSEPDSKPVLFVGQSNHLAALDWKDVRCKLEPHVTQEVWNRSISCITESPGESCPLWPRGATVASLPVERSRHAAPSRCHALAKVIKNSAPKKVQFIVLVCRKRDVYASVMAIARSFPLFSARTGGVNPVNAVVETDRTVQLEIMLVGDQPDGDTEADLGTLDPYLYDTTLSNEDLDVLRHSAEATRMAARITDTPTNYMNVDELIEEAIQVSKDLNLHPPTIIRGEQLKSKGLGGIYGVGKASACPPALVVLSYKGGDVDVAWVGKGIVYDTGGLSIKARTSMVGMKSDCGGAAAVLGAFASFVRTKPKINLHAVLCIAENSVGPKSTRPDDIHTLYSGLTVEINNTDAEGRLVLSDGVVYADRDLKAKIIVDVATLTGAQGIATGKYHAAVICNNATLEAKAIKAGLLSGDLTHALPFAPDLHFSELSSVVADMKNSVADRNNAQPSCAGLFILAHLGFRYSGQWLHVDMAAPAHCGERSTGYGVSLLNVLFGSHSQSKLLQALSPGLTTLP